MRAVLVFVAAALVAGAPAAVADGEQLDAPSSGIHTGTLGRTALDGTWVYADDRRATGTGRDFQSGAFRGRTVRVPYSPNARVITGRAGFRSHRGSVGWYRTAVTVPSDGTYVLRFESVNHKADVWVDGRHVTSHAGTYLPFEARVDLQAGRQHQLVVRADWRNPYKMKREGWHRMWFNFGGINREVTIRRLGPSEVRAPTFRTRLVDGGRKALIDVSVEVRNWSSARSIQPVGALERGDRRVELQFEPADVPGGDSRLVRAHAEVDDPALWSTEDPALWDLVVVVPGESGWRGRVGMREIRRDGHRILLNDRPIKLVGASLHEDAPGRGDALLPEDQDEVVRQLKALGANATRAQHPLSPGLLERLDAAGILVWQGIGPVDAPGAWTSRGPEKLRRAHQRVRATVRQAQTHPSILAWNLANEVAGQGHPAGQVPYIRKAARELKRRDPGRLVALDIWGAHPPRENGPIYEHIDAIGWTNYIGWYEATFHSPSRLSGRIRARLGTLRRAFPTKIIAVTEFGAEGNTRNAYDQPGGYGFQARLMRTHLRTYGSIPGLAGALVWNLRDFAVAPSFAGGSISRQVPGIRLVRGLNQKGLRTYRGRPKPAHRVVREELARIRAR